MKKHRKGFMTLAEHNAQLKAEGKWDDVAARFDEKNKILSERKASLDQAEKPLINALRQSGFAVSTVWDFVSWEQPYGLAIPILLDHLSHPYPDRIREGIARALAIPDSKPHWNRLISEYEKCSDTFNRGTKQGLAATIAIIAEDAVMVDVLRLVQDESHGESRVLLLRGLKTSMLPEVKQMLRGLKDDPILQKEIRAWN